MIYHFFSIHAVFFLTLVNSLFSQETSTPVSTKNSFHRLVNIAKVNSEIVLDLRYATHDNFLHFPVYSKALCFVHEDVALRLQKIQNELSTLHLKLKIFDGYRPLQAQKIMWDAVQDERYVANPVKNKGRHTRGTAIDVTLTDAMGHELEMPTAFDDFSEKAQSTYIKNVSLKAQENRALLQKIMEKHHFKSCKTEWWHFDFEGWTNDEKYPALDVSFEELEKDA